MGTCTDFESPYTEIWPDSRIGFFKIVGHRRPTQHERLGVGVVVTEEAIPEAIATIVSALNLGAGAYSRELLEPVRYVDLADLKSRVSNG